MKDGAHHYGFSPLAGVTAGTASILLCFGVLLLAWHRVAGQVGVAIMVLVWGLVLAVLAYAFLWLRHRVRHPETLAGRQAVRAEVVDAAPQVIEPPVVQPAAIEPPRVYLNVTDDQLAAIMRRHAEGERS